jgi:hypothetical protein
MGYYADQYKARGSMYLATNMASPYCGYHHFFELAVSDKSEKNSGDLFLTINSDATKILSYK